MTVAIVHYHLRTGGVTTVIARTSRAFTRDGIRHVILTGEAPEESLADLPVAIVPDLAYRKTQTSTPLASSLIAAATTQLGQPPDLWHFHNYSLGKNPSLPAAVAELAASGAPLLLQMHDLAENGRPQNYRNIPDKSRLYPVSPKIRYAFLNQRDLGLFIDAGLPPEITSLLVNPVEPELIAAEPSPTPLVFAPVRGIRRKNLGELLLLSAIAPHGTRFAISRAPLDPDALAIHQTWRDFSKRHRLPTEFDVSNKQAPRLGADTSFESWIRHATHIVSTSVEEGFGLPFLEAVAWRKPLLGRKLPVPSALHTGNLYDKLLVPADWVEAPLLKDQLQSALERDFRGYGRKLPATHMAAVLASLETDGWFDFANLSEPLQQGVIERLDTPSARKVPLVEINGSREPAADWIARALTEQIPSDTDLRPFSASVLVESIKAIHSDLTTAAAGRLSFLPADLLLDRFLAPSSFHFLLSTPPPRSTKPFPFSAVVFDVYGTLLIAPSGGVKPDPAADEKLRAVIRHFGYEPPESPSTAIHTAVTVHHARSDAEFPEVDLRVLWREVLDIEPGAEITALVTAIEDAWHPAKPMPGAEAFIRHLARSGVSLGLLSNAQCNTLPSMSEIADLFAPELSILSYQQGIAKPSPELFGMMADRLAGRGIRPHETLYIGNDPLHDIIPASHAGFQTALFVGHPDSHRPGDCTPDFMIHRWQDLLDPRWWKMHTES
jgi:FMN phosphatase YigB (HAD superfamily)